MLKTGYKACLLGAILVTGVGHAALRVAGDVPIADSRVFPENIAAGPDGTLWIGSAGRAAVYRALPNETTAKAWIAPGAHGLKRVMGLYYDSDRNLLWVCDAGERPADGSPATASIRTFDPKTATQQASFPFKADGGCNDLTIGSDGAVYVSDFEGARIFRLKPGEKAFTPWLKDERLAAVDGLAFLADGDLYVNTFREGGLYRIPVNADGSAGSPVQLTVSQPLERPDAMRTIAADTLLVAEGGGKISAITIRGENAVVRVVRDGFVDGPAAAVLVEDTVFAVQAKFAKMRDPTTDPGTFVVAAMPLQ